MDNLAYGALHRIYRLFCSKLFRYTALTIMVIVFVLFPIYSIPVYTFCFFLLFFSTVDTVNEHRARLEATKSNQSLPS